MMVSDAITHREGALRLGFVVGGVTNDAPAGLLERPQPVPPPNAPVPAGGTATRNSTATYTARANAAGGAGKGPVGIARSGPSRWARTGSLRLSSSPWLVGWLA